MSRLRKGNSYTGASVLIFFAFYAISFGQQANAGCGVSGPGAAIPKEAPTFEVVSVKQTDPEKHFSSMSFDPDGIRIKGFTLKAFIHLAYGIDAELIYGGPKWIDASGFEIQAKVSEPDVDALKSMSRDERKAMLQPILKDRFGLAFHCEEKILPAYELTVAKSGSKLRPHPAPLNGAQVGSAQVPRGAIDIRPYDIQGFDIPMTLLSQQLHSILQQRVIDKTNLTGNYDFHLKWSPDDEPTSSVRSGNDRTQQPASSGFGPSFFTAMEEQMGLKLHYAKEGQKTIVIDEAHIPAPE